MVFIENIKSIKKQKNKTNITNNKLRKGRYMIMSKQENRKLHFETIFFIIWLSYQYSKTQESFLPKYSINLR